MKRISSVIFVAFTLGACASTPQAVTDQSGVTEATAQAATAEAAPAPAPETVILKAKPGKITFHHKKHAERMKCTVCHGQKPGKMAPLGRDAGHKLCLDCHKQGKKGPTKCGDCHKK